MVNIGEVIFYKALVLSAWAAFKEVRERRKASGFTPASIAVAQRYWNARCAKQPRLLTDERPHVLKRRRSPE